MQLAVCRSVFSSLVAAVVLGLSVAPASHSAEPTTGRLIVIVKVSDNALAGTPARVSGVTPDGVLVDYAEEFLDRAPNAQSFVLDRLGAGVLDVRVEGEGLVTEVKKGVPVFAGRDERVTFVVTPGSGAHIVEFAVAGLSREEVATRLRSLEAETGKLRAALEALEARTRNDG
jgi:hypothetical protein